MNKCMRWIVLSGAIFAVEAQVPDQIQRATISGSRGTSGKCTIEVRVDASAEVDVVGDSGRLRTIAGQPATWTRMVCTDGLPTTMSDFKFKGIDGRGSVKLIQDPRNNNGMAVIRIDDTKGGAEGYTFDLEWSGASGTARTGAFDTGGYYPSTGRGSVLDPSTGQGSALDPSTRGGRRNTARGGSRALSTQRAIDLCRNEVRARGERDYGLRDIDITTAGVATGSGRRDSIEGRFRDGSVSSRRGAGYRFNCDVDYATGQVRNVEILRANGTAVQPSSSSGTYTTGQSGATGYDQTRAFRACQDAVVARASRDGYQNVRFSSIALDGNRSNWVSGALTASRGPVSDNFDFGCSMDLGAARVQQVDLTRR